MINTTNGFVVTSQTDSGSIYIGNTSQNVTWNVVGTNTFPINTANVTIYMSRDGGNTWPDSMGTFPNTGSAYIKLPNPDTNINANARIKVKGTGNIFFNVNKYNFSVRHSTGADTSSEITLRPVPAHNTIRISSGSKGLLQVVIYNAIGQQVSKGKLDGELDIDVSMWARGVYFMKSIDTKNQRTIKKFVLWQK